MSSFCELDIEVDPENYRPSAILILAVIKPDWKEDEIQVKVQSYWHSHSTTLSLQQYTGYVLSYLIITIIKGQVSVKDTPTKTPSILSFCSLCLFICLYISYLYLSFSIYLSLYLSFSIYLSIYIYFLLSVFIPLFGTNLGNNEIERHLFYGQKSKLYATCNCLSNFYSVHQVPVAKNCPGVLNINILRL